MRSPQLEDDPQPGEVLRVQVLPPEEEALLENHHLVQGPQQQLEYLFPKPNPMIFTQCVLVFVVV